MKDQIFNAISDKLRNLVIDDTNDSSITYAHTEAINEHIHSVESIAELNKLFHEGHDIFKYDTSKCMKLILRNGQEISLHEYIKIKKQVTFVKIITDEIIRNDGDNTLTIYRNKLQKILLRFYNDDTYYARTCQDFDDSHVVPKSGKYSIDDKKDPDSFQGYISTYENANIESNPNGYPAINYIKNLKPVYGHRAYMPSLGELMIVLRYKDMINYILKIIGGTNKYDTDNYIWTSTEYNKYKNWAWNKDRFITEEKQLVNTAMPFFKKIN